MKNRKNLLSVLLLTISSFASAQTLSGGVVDKQNMPVEFANVVVLSLPDSNFVAGAVSDINGHFSFQKLPFTNFLIRVSSIGYVTSYKVFRPSINEVSKIVLESDNKVLNEIVVKAKRPSYKMENGNMETIVQGSLLSGMGDVIDVLRYIPGLIEKNGEYTVFGKGTPLFYINGKQVRDDNELERLKASSIKSIQVINNPSSRYDAEVKSVILIKTIREKGQGLSFNIRSLYSQGRYARTSQKIDVNYRYNSLDLFASINFKQNENRYRNDASQIVSVDTIWEQKNDQIKKSNVQKLSTVVGLNDDINENHSFGLTYTIDIVPHHKEWGSLISKVNANSQFYDNWSSTLFSRYHEKPMHQLNSYYSGKLGKMGIDFNFDFLQSKVDRANYANEESLSFEDRDVTSENNVKSQLYASKVILSYPVIGGKVEIGEEMTYTRRKDFYENPQGIVESSNNYIKENRNALFFEYNRMLGKYTNMRLGLRYEHVNTNYYENEQKKVEQSRSYGNWFPALSLSGLLNKSLQYSLSYTVKIKRPNYSQLSSNVDYLNRLTYQRGNPYLKQSNIHDITLGGVINRFIQFSVSYQYQRDPITWNMQQLSNDQKITLVSYKNIDKMQNITVYASVAPTFGFWHPQLNLGVQKQWLSIDYLDRKKKMNKPMYMGAFNNSFEISNGWVLSADVNTFQSKGNYQNIYLNKNLFVLNASIRKSFMKKKLDVNLQFFDLLKGQSDGNIIYNPNMILTTTNHYDSRRVQFSISYNLSSI